MLKFVILLVVVAAAAAGPVATPLLAKLNPQPAEAPANTEHAGYVGLTPVIRSVVSLQPAIYSGLYSAEIPLAYANNYVAYATPIEASNVRISY